MMKVRNATLSKKDVDAIYNINKKSLPVYYSHTEHMEFIMKNDHNVLVIENNNIINGYCIYHHHSNDRVHIISIAIDKKYRNNGYGKKLINAIPLNLVKFKKEIKRITLYVMETNKDAIEFYKKNGFEELKKMEHYYGYGVNGIMFEKLI